MKKYLLFFLFLIGFFSAFAQQAGDKPEMADGLYASGKIYVVVAVALVILSGIFIYLLLLDRRVSRLEKKVHGVK